MRCTASTATHGNWKRRARQSAFASALCAVLLTASVPAAAEPRATLTVVVTNFRNDKGRALVKLANSSADYDAEDKGFRLGEAKIENQRTTLTYADLPYGDYAVKIFQDENDNQKLDIGLMGPKESYGFSNNAMGTFGPPSWEQAKFRVAQPEVSIQIETK